MTIDERMTAVGMWRHATLCLDVPMMQVWYWPAFLAVWESIGLIHATRALWGNR